ncbi:hypothetical protein BDQ12DRAFT_593696 [Crucibulum laeve]|uniref:Cytochrome c domain-containing protein n=1 Tax=Crucibulum laeve TaxID=68775 RepID=A0A5C3MH00_9AGAR|nr:hypothetical protein BDQ12DRAFT_593696 [Crucibulum laeve]
MYSEEPAPTPDEIQFNTSSIYSVPPGYTAWEIRNDYPAPKPDDVAPEGPPIGTLDAPWLNVDPISNPQYYLEIIKTYCFDGMINNDFIPQKNKTWAIGFYNSAGASVFGGMWKDPSNPDWSTDAKFPVGSLVFKFLLTNADDEELPILKGAPTWDALIAIQPADKTKSPNPKNRDLENPKPLRLLQMDIATRDDRSTTGWMFGTFMYYGRPGQCVVSGYDALIPVGLQWGNDPELTQAAFEAGEKPTQVWINPEATDVRVALHGGRPSWGWNGRLNGPADNFISACASCHSTAQWPANFNMVPPAPIQKNGKFVPKDDTQTMKWFTNIPCGTAISEGSVSGDYSLQLLIGYQNFQVWKSKQQPTKPSDEDKLPGAPITNLPTHPRQGPHFEF